MTDECIFCQIAGGKIPADLVYEDNDIVAFTDINPEAPVHLIIIPRNHIASLNDLEKKDTELLGRINMTAITLAKQRGLDKTGYRLVSNMGRQAGQTVDHVHYHLLGGRFMMWPPG